MSQDDARQQLEDAFLGSGDLAAALDAIRCGADVHAPFLDGSAPLSRSPLIRAIVGVSVVGNPAARRR